MLVLGLESSCDDCSAAVVEESARGPQIISLIRKTQDHLHAPYGGVVPELAAREHLIQLRSVIQSALTQANVKAADLERIAVTRGPGLIGCLLTTFSAAKAMAWYSKVPFIGVNHLLGHLNAARFAEPNLPFPALALLVSGGHTHLYLAESWVNLRLLMKTRDDAAGEAFDKTARILNLGYPGGPAVDERAKSAVELAPPFTPPKFKDGTPSWSFSGLKTAVKQRVESNPALSKADESVGALCKTVNETITAWLLKPIPDFVGIHSAASLVVSGGVACNSELRAGAARLGKKLGITVSIPEPRLCTDNGAMIASAGAILSASAAPWTENADADLKL
ncbi:MAG: tRNA (adenosine(37)-N6)-threonylcarbamoyltransferase complex transferase subunit TsaD [Holophagales bacterium]|jgi:N6-L-threonylcarbamoyladenine synthase|nr:tRNA (adenosine(37)-N6)-threonylcarbamoyltransferase complex transferase subunit TsaD [Holophagales bacterium]